MKRCLFGIMKKSVDDFADNAVQAVDMTILYKNSDCMIIKIINDFVNGARQTDNTALLILKRLL